MCYYCVVKIYVGINATAQEVFSICIKPLGVLYDYCVISVGINATAQEVHVVYNFRGACINLAIKCYCVLL